MNDIKSTVISVLNEWFNDCSIDYQGISEVDKSSEKSLMSLKPELAQAAQIVYDHWQQDEEGYCDSHGNGGICGDIADALADTLSKYDIECTTVSSDHEVHVYVVAKIENEGLYLVDISPYTYETGGGYCWKKIPDVVIDSYDVIINKLSSDPEDFNNYNLDETYEDVGMDYVKYNIPKLDQRSDYDDKKVIGNFTYLNFNDVDNYSKWFVWGNIYVYDNTDGTEVANSSYGKQYEWSELRPSIDVRPDKRRLGIASNIYQWIEELVGDTLHPDKPHSPSAEKLWANPNRKFGLEKVINEILSEFIANRNTRYYAQS